MLGLACLLSIALGAGQERQFAIGPVPAWVDPAELDPAPDVPVEELRGGTYSVLVDTQDRFVDGEISTYGDYAWYVHDTQGVQNGSQLSIDFDPSYQALTIHAIEVIRGGEVLDRLIPEDIEVVQREEELDARIYDGTRTALVFVEDVRPGDVVHHAYTLRGSNPAFAGHYMRTISLAGAAPLGRLRHRLLWPSERPLTILPHGTAVEPAISEQHGVREYRWEVRDVPAIELLDAEPAWYFATPFIQFTSFRNWNEVARWEAGLLDPACEVGADLAAEIEAIRLEEEGPFDRALAAVRFVQDGVRYLGIELGPGAYAASPPDAVYARRFGDCKDKSLLLATMLRELEIETQIGLVSWTLRQTIPEYAPSSALFDHVIVRVDLPGGPYWIDPTESLVGGDLRSYTPPPFGQALVVDEATERPEPITNAGRRGITRVEYRIEAREIGGPALLEVVTRYEGRPANSFRASYGWTTARQYTQDCREYYASFYESAESLMEVEMEDDLEANVVTTTERYSIPGFWSDYGDELWGEFYAMEIDYLLPLLTPGRHEHPVAIDHPVHFEHSIIARLSDEWWLEPESEVLENAGFRFTFDSDFDDLTNILQLDYTYRSKADHVLPAEVERFIADVDRAEELVGYDISYEVDFDQESLEAFAAASAAILLALLSVGGLAAVVGLRSYALQRGRPHAEVLADVVQRSPWQTMWTRPRATMRALLDSRLEPRGTGIVVLAGMLAGLNMAEGLGAGMPLAFHAGVVTGGALGLVIHMYVSGWILAPVGRWLGGGARAPQVRRAFAWSRIPAVVFGLVWFLRLLVFREELFTEETPRMDASLALSAAYAGFLTFEILAGVWVFVVFLKCLAEAHRFSTWRALATVLIPLSALLLLVTLVVLGAVVVSA